MAEREGFDEERSTSVQATRAGARSAEATLIKKSLARRAKSKRNNQKSAGKFHLPKPIFYFAVIF